MANRLILLLMISHLIKGDGFVEEVACTGSSMTIVVNKSDSDVSKWVRDPSARPIVYVYGHKDRTPCGMSVKPSGLLENTSAASVQYNFTIPYGPTCSVYLADLEPNFQTAETTVAIENNAGGDSKRGIRVNHVFCLYTKQVETLRISDVSNAHEVVASVGGKPKPKVQMLFRDPDGKPLRAAKFGDPVGLYLMLQPDNAYKAINPKHCLFSDREEMEEPDAKTLTFVQSNCPVTELSEVVRPVSELNDEVYFTHFQAFRFGERPTVYAHCKVEVCLDQNECTKKNCYPKVVNSTLAADVARFRLKRGASIGDTVSSLRGIGDEGKIGEEIAISNALTVLDHGQSVEVTSKTADVCINQRVYHSLFLVFGLLMLLLLLTVVLIIHFSRKLRRYKKAAIAAMNLPSVYYAFPSQSGASTTLAPSSTHRLTRPMSVAYSPVGGFRGSLPSGLNYDTSRSDAVTTDQGGAMEGLPRRASYMPSLLISDDHAIPRVRNIH